MDQNTLLPDLEAMEMEEEEAACRSELTLTNSDSSAVTIDSSKDFDGQSPEWTNEKHNLYLDSLEASFVDQLQHWHSQENRWGLYIFRGVPANNCTSDKDKALRDGDWQKINFEMTEPLLDSTADSHVTLESPRINHFRSADESCIVTSLDLQKQWVSGGIRGSSSFSCEKKRSSERHLVGSIKEVSDQNFVDEHQGEKSSCMATVKRLKTAAADS